MMGKLSAIAKANNTRTGVFFFAILFLSAPAFAQVGKSSEPKFTPSSNQRVLLKLMAERDRVRTGGAIAGVVLSPLVLTAGSVLVGLGAKTLGDDTLRACDSDPKCGDRKVAKAEVAIGSVAVVAGTLSLALTVRALRKRKDKVSDLDRRIQMMQMQSSRVSLAFGGVQKPALVRW